MTSLRSALVLQVIRDIFVRRASSRKVLVVCDRCMTDGYFLDLRDVSKRAGRLKALCRPGVVLHCPVCRGALKAAAVNPASILPSATVVDLAAFRRSYHKNGKRVHTATNRVRGQR